jgi:hypothetical protein
MRKRLEGVDLVGVCSLDGRKERLGALSFHVKSSFAEFKATIWRGVIIGSVTGTQNTTLHHEAW